MARTFSFEIPVWKAIVIYSCGKPDAKTRAFYKKWLIDEEMDGFFNLPESTQGRVHRGNRAIVVIWTRDLPRTPQGIGVLVHEVTHAVNGLLNNKGVTFSWKSEEAYTYLAEYITTQILTRLKKKK